MRKLVYPCMADKSCNRQGLDFLQNASCNLPETVANRHTALQLQTCCPFAAPQQLPHAPRNDSHYQSNYNALKLPTCCPLIGAPGGPASCLARRQEAQQVLQCTGARVCPHGHLPGPHDWQGPQQCQGAASREERGAEAEHGAANPQQPPRYGLECGAQLLGGEGRASGQSPETRGENVRAEPSLL